MRRTRLVGRRWIGVLAHALVVMAGCQRPLAPEPTQPRALAAGAVASPARAATTLLDAELRYTVREASGPREIHTPMVRARVSGVECWLILDTGATDPVFTRALAARIGATLTPTEPGTDHAGAPVASWSSEGDWDLAIDGWRRSIRAPLVIEGPPPFEEWGIGGFLSPQQLDPSATMVLDLRRQRLLLVEGPPDALLSAPDDLEALSLPRLSGTGDAARLLLVEGAVGTSPVRIMLNTGGQDVELSPWALRDAVHGAPAEVVDSGRGLSGAAVIGERRDVVLSLAGRSLAVDDVLVREQGPSYGGQLGIRALRGTILVVSHDPAEPIRWWRRSDASM